jgi:L,D-transpeptidase catalytic domain
MLKQIESNNPNHEPFSLTERISNKEFNYQRYLVFLSAVLFGISNFNLPANAKSEIQTKLHKIETPNFKTAQEIGDTSSNSLEGKDIIKVNLKLSTYTMSVYQGEKLIHSFKVGIGKDICKLKDGTTINCKTPTGEFEVIRLTKNPDPKDARISLPKCVKGGLLGCFFVGFKEVYDPKTNIADFYGAHGSPFTETIGQKKSTGCIRMFGKDSETLYKIVKIGTQFSVTE